MHHRYLAPDGLAVGSTKCKWRGQMRRIIMALALLASTSISSVAASANADLVCLAGGAENDLKCDYGNLEQCRATASGGLGYCVTNPAYASSAYAGLRGTAMSAVDDLSGRLKQTKLLLRSRVHRPEFAR